MTKTRHKQIRKTFGWRLQKAREAVGYKSAQQLVGLLGIKPNYDTLTRIFELLNITPNYLLPLAAERGTGQATA